MSFRKIIFWGHLVAGMVAGAVILIMCTTGVVLAFEKEIIAWAEADLRRIEEPPAGAARLETEEMLERVRAAHPEFRPTGITVYADPAAAVLLAAGRTNAVYVDPYRGKIRSPNPGLRRFMQTMIEWHRWVGRAGERRELGKAITGACNAAFLMLAISGIYLWWPRRWTKSVLAASAVLNVTLRGKARDWNWHNSIGIWSAPVLIVLTATALPISYQWAGDLIYKITRSEPPPAGGRTGAADVRIASPPPGTKAKPHSALFAAAQAAVPRWEQMTLRLGGGGARAARGAQGKAKESGGPEPVTIAVKEAKGGDSPRFASVQVLLDPFTGEILRKEGFDSYNSGRKVRSWMRFLHTGEALGPAGQAVAGMASLGGAALVWTGLALAIRRFLGWRAAPRLEPQGRPAEEPVSAQDDR